MERVLQLRHFAHDHLHPQWLLHDLWTGVERRRPDCGLDRLAGDQPPGPSRRAFDGRTGVEVPDGGRHLLLGVQPGRRALGVVHGLVQPARPHRHRGRRRLRLRVVLELGSRFVRASLHSQLHDDEPVDHPAQHVHPVLSHSRLCTASSTSSPRTWCRC